MSVFIMYRIYLFIYLLTMYLLSFLEYIYLFTMPLFYVPCHCLLTMYLFSFLECIYLVGFNKMIIIFNVLYNNYITYK